ncbi:MAG: hypothetical protein IKC35_01615 [Clostridia bacterium]|nr:hypothetical protein [Clostridia bacterium]
MATVALAESIDSQPSNTITELADADLSRSTNYNPICTIYTSTEIDDKTTLLSPNNVTYNNVSVYNTAVVYHWDTNGYGTELALSNSNSVYYLMGTTTYKDIVFPSFVNSTECVPNFKYAKSYSSTSNNYSDYTTIAWEYLENNGEYISVNYYHDCELKVKGRFDAIHFVGSTVPTEYDQSSFVWEHGLAWNKWIYGTVTYNGEVSDIEVKVPLVGYKTTTVTVGGVSFSLRTGPNKVSIKANSTANINTFNFAFGV